MNKYDVGIVGESLLAPFIAGLLAQNHGKKTCLFLSRGIQHRIVREINISFDIVTRPESWELLNSAVEEALPIITKISGASAIGKTHALVQSHTPSGANILSHMYHYLHGMDFQIERLADNEFPSTSAAYRARGIRFVRPSILWPAIFDWLTKLGVEIVEPDDLTIKSRKDGSGEVRIAKAAFDVGHIVLADESSIQRHAMASIVERFFCPAEATALLLQPGANQIGHIVMSPEYDFCAQTDMMGHIKCLADTSIFHMADLLNSNIDAKGQHFHLSGRSVYTKLLPRDGAPVVGKLGRSNLWGIGGFGHGSIFFAPAFARLISASSTEQEIKYFSMRGADIKRNSNQIHDRLSRKSRAENE